MSQQPFLVMSGRGSSPTELPPEVIFLHSYDTLPSAYQQLVISDNQNEEENKNEKSTLLYHCQEVSLWFPDDQDQHELSQDEGDVKTNSSKIKYFRLQV